jgi:hypothetical protein
MCGPCWRIAITISPSFIWRWRRPAWFMPESTARIDCRGVSPEKVWMTGE